MSNSFLLIFVIGTQLLHSVYSEYVPVYIFEQSNSEDLEQTFSRVSQDTFKEIVYSRLNENIPIVTFAEKKLSPEDFIKSGSKVFSNLEKLKENNNVTYLPQVEDPTSVLTSIKDYVKISINTLSEKKSLPKLKPNQILIIDLDDANENENRPQLLKRHDENIYRLYNELLEHFGKLTAIYTGYSASWITSEDIINHRLVREALLEEVPATTKYFNDTNFMIYFGANPKQYNDTNITEFIVNNISTDKQENTLNVTINNVNGTDVIYMNFLFNAGYWYLEELKTNNYVYVIREITAPTTFSYHCSDLKLQDKNGYEIVFQEVQFQIIMNDTINQFSDAYDCVGFTTIPIWSGLFVTLILSIIMTMGLTMIMDIKTMDRFDDPKGKTIIINASE